jgi:hypothetical protein
MLLESSTEGEQDVIRSRRSPQYAKLKELHPAATQRRDKAGMAESADAADSKSAEGNLVGVRPPLPAPTLLQALCD